MTITPFITDAQTDQKIQQALGSVSGGYKGIITLYDVKTHDGVYTPIDIGTYVNADNLVYDPNGVDAGDVVQFILYNGTWTKNSIKLSDSNAGNKLSILSNSIYPNVRNKIPNWFAKWKIRQNDLTVLVHGDSLSVRDSNNTQFPNPERRPPLLNGKNWASAVWDRLKWGLENFYRFDANGLDSNPRFSETSGFVTVQPQPGGTPSNGIDDSIWDDYKRRNGITRMYSGTGSASVTFSMIDTNNDKEASLDFIYRTDLGGCDNCKVSIAEGDGLLKVWDKTSSAYVEANNYTFSMKHDAVSTYRGNTKFNEILRFKAVIIGDIDSRNQAKTITISKENTSNCRFMYWGIQTSTEPYMMRIVSSGRGGLAFSTMLPFIDDDIFGQNPDLIIQEIPINGGINIPNGPNLPQYYVDEVESWIFDASNPKSLKSNSGNTPWSDYEVVTWTPHCTLSSFKDEDSFVSSKMSDDYWYSTADNRRWIAQYFNLNEETGVIFVDMFERWLLESKAIYGNIREGFITSSTESEESFIRDGTHMNDLGVKIMTKHILSIFE